MFCEGIEGAFVPVALLSTTSCRRMGERMHGSTHSYPRVMVEMAEYDYRTSLVSMKQSQTRKTGASKGNLVRNMERANNIPV
jgi:hypothetical protein